MLSIHLYFKPGITQGDVDGLTRLLKLSSTIENKKGDKYLKFHTCHHFFVFTEEFMPDSFVKMANSLVSKITFRDSTVLEAGNKSKYFKLGETELSFDGMDIMMIGKNLNSMLKLYKYFIDNKGKVKACKKAYTEESRLRREIKKIAQINYALIQDNKRVKSLETENEVLKLKRKFYEDKFNELKDLIKNSFWSFLFPKPKELTLEEASFTWPKDIEFSRNTVTK